MSVRSLYPHWCDSVVRSQLRASFTRMMLEVARSSELRTGTPLKMGLSAAPFTWWPLGDFLFMFTSLAFPCRKLSLPTSVHIPAGACTTQSGLANRARSEVECPWLKYTSVSPLAGGALDTDFFNSTSCNSMCLRVRSQELIFPMLLTLHKKRCWLLANPS